jgi:hypothetical protein
VVQQLPRRRPDGKARCQQRRAPFEAIAQMSSTTMIDASPPMPDLHLSRGEIDDLSSYILSLRHK